MGIAFAGIQAFTLNTMLKLNGGKDKSSKGAAHAE
jgi:hypothetical protein